MRVNRMRKDWCKAIGLKVNYGDHTLRKIWGYHMWMTNAKGFAVIMVRFEHSYTKVTMRSLGAEAEEVNHMLLNEV